MGDDRGGARSTSGFIEPTNQCIFTHRDGRRCGRPAVVGTRVCTSHGANAEHVRKAAAERLIQALPEAIESVTRLLDPIKRDQDGNEVPCPLCGRGLLRDENVTLKAATTVLDRTGFGPSAKIEVSRADESAWLRYLEPHQLEQIETWMNEATEKMRKEEESVGLLPPEQVM